MTKLSKDKRKFSTNSLFATYLANMNISLSSHPKETNRERKSKVVDPDNRPAIHNGNSKSVQFSDDTKIESLIKHIASEHEWFEDEMRSDVSILIKNRLYTVGDLRILSKESWKEIELLPIVKDLLREAIDHGKPQSAELLEKIKEKRLSRDVIVSSTSTTTPISTNNNIDNNGATSTKKDTTNLQLSSPPKNKASNRSEITKFPIYFPSLPQQSQSQSQSQLQQQQQQPIASPKYLHNIINHTTATTTINDNNNNKDGSNLPIDNVNPKVATKAITEKTTKTTTTVLNPISKSNNIKQF